MNTNNYEYFCGANVAIKFNGYEQLDLAGISYQVTDSSTPIYGYASRTFDAVAPGQKLVRGNFVVNYTEYNAVAKSIANSKYKIKGEKPGGFNTDAGAYSLQESLTGFARYNTIKDQHIDVIKTNGWVVQEGEDGLVGGIREANLEDFIVYIERVMYSDTYDDVDAVSLGINLMEHFSVEQKPPVYPSQTMTKKQNITSLDALLLGPFNIEILFKTSSDERPNGFTIVNCYVNSIGGTIQISEDVLLQEFSFYGRNVVSYE